MARAVRVEYEGAWYHLMARGNRLEKIFLDDKDREVFLNALVEVFGMTGCEVHAWVLMSNHYHLVIRTPELFWNLAFSPDGKRLVSSGPNGTKVWDVTPEDEQKAGPHNPGR